MSRLLTVAEIERMNLNNAKRNLYGMQHAPVPKPNTPRLNDDERRLWVLNDEGLYSWFTCSRQSMRAFLKDNRAEIDACILGVVR